MGYFDLLNIAWDSVKWLTCFFRIGSKLFNTFVMFMFIFPDMIIELIILSQEYRCKSSDRVCGQLYLFGLAKGHIFRGY